MAGAVCGALQIAQLERFGDWHRSLGDDLLLTAHRHLARLFGDRLQGCWLPPASFRWLFMAIAKLMQRRHHRLDQSATRIPHAPHLTWLAVLRYTISSRNDGPVSLRTGAPQPLARLQQESA
jgi:hypothetical protein